MPGLLADPAVFDDLQRLRVYRERELGWQIPELVRWPVFQQMLVFAQMPGDAVAKRRVAEPPGEAVFLAGESSHFPHVVVHDIEQGFFFFGCEIGVGRHFNFHSVSSRGQQGQKE